MRKDRLLWVAVGALVMVCAAAALYVRGPSGLPWLPGCTFRYLTGLNCPGCGMTRAAHATLHGRIGDAFRFNPVGMILLPMAFVGLSCELIGWVRGKPLPFRFNVGARGAKLIAVVVISFWILRNVPAWPFTLLSPP